MPRGGGGAGADPSEEQVLAYLSKLTSEDAKALLAKAQKDEPESTTLAPQHQERAEPERSINAAKDAMRAIAAGNFAAARELGFRSDMCYLGEDGWGCLHWVVHAAGAALAAGKEHEVGCQCCHSCSASGRGPALALLQEFLRCEQGHLAVDFQTSQGATALMFAADAGDKEACLALLRMRADISLRDCDGDDAQGWALAKGHADLAELLRSAG